MSLSSMIVPSHMLLPPGMVVNMRPLCIAISDPPLVSWIAILIMLDSVTSFAYMTTLICLQGHMILNEVLWISLLAIC